MVEGPLISVCIASYNHEKYLGEAIESVLIQSYQNVELIVVDDASTDESPQILRDYQSKHPNRILALCLQANVGPSQALNQALGRAKGRFIALLGSDDRMRRNRLEKQLEFMQDHPDAGVVFTRVNCIDGNGHSAAHPDDIFDIPITDVRWQLLNQNILNAPSAMMRKEAVDRIGPFNPALLYVQDYDYWLRILDEHEIYILPDRLTDYRIHDKNLSMQQDGPRFGACYETVIIILRAIDRWPLEKLFILKASLGSPERKAEEAAARAELAHHCLELDRRYFGRPFLCTSMAYALVLDALESEPKNPALTELLDNVHAALGDNPRSLGKKSLPLWSWLGTHTQKKNEGRWTKLAYLLNRHLLWRFKKP